MKQVFTPTHSGHVFIYMYYLLFLFLSIAALLDRVTNKKYTQFYYYIIVYHRESSIVLDILGCS